MFGSHLSIAGGMENALFEAQRLTMDCVQVFTKNQRQWQVKPLALQQIDRWFAAMEQTRIHETVSHASYLINLASPDRTLRSKSIRLFEDEVRRCDAMSIPYLIVHPGAHMGQGEQKGLSRIAESINKLHDKLPNAKVVTCLEVTAGQGTSLGCTFEHLAAIIDQVDADERLGVCLDTAHMIAAGYDLTRAAGMRKVIRELNHVIGLDRVKVIHLNDSKIERGGRVDRHEHIGLGHVAIEAFEVLVNHPKLRQLPKILETAKKVSPDGRPWDTVNLEILRGLQRSQSKKKQKSLDLRVFEAENSSDR